jgi:hypothetical protein
VLAGLAALAAAAGGLAARLEPTPVLVELFTSQGCSSCPPADRLLAELAAGAGVEGARVVPLSLHVDYWNRLGWTDPFSSSAHSQRQRAYAVGDDRAYTPQMVVDGAARFVGSDAGRARRAIAEAARRSKGRVALVARRRDGESLSIDVVASALPPAEGGAEVVLALTQGGLAVRVPRGENAGRRLEHAAVVRSWAVLGRVRESRFEGSGVLEVDPAWRELTAVAFVQERAGARRVLGVGTLTLDAAGRAE